MVRGIRGAITSENTVSDISEDSKLMFSELIRKNNINEDDIVSIFFSMTKDLDAVYPAKAIRELGYSNVPFVCFQELNIENSLRKCIRVLVQINSDKANSEFEHIYLKGAKVLRPDLLKKE